jgi:CRP-like cAMP-binding protein
MPRAAVDIDQLISASAVFGPLPEPVRARLVAAARIESFEVPTLLSAAQQPLASLRLVLKGHIDLVARSASGLESKLTHIGPGDWVTWLGCFAAERPLYDFYSSARASYLALPTSLVRNVAQECTDMYPRVIEQMGKRMRLLMEWQGLSVMLAPEQRMAKLLHVMARAYGAVDGNRASLPTTQSQLANQARCSRQVANQLLGALQRRGLVRHAYSRYEIDDIERLVAFIEQDGLD